MEKPTSWRKTKFYVWKFTKVLTNRRIVLFCISFSIQVIPWFWYTAASSGLSFITIYIIIACLIWVVHFRIPINLPKKSCSWIIDCPRLLFFNLFLSYLFCCFHLLTLTFFINCAAKLCHIHIFLHSPQSKYIVHILIISSSLYCLHWSLHYLLYILLRLHQTWILPHDMLGQ